VIYDFLVHASPGSGVDPGTLHAIQPVPEFHCASIEDSGFWVSIPNLLIELMGFGIAKSPYFHAREATTIAPPFCRRRRTTVLSVALTVRSTFTKLDAPTGAGLGQSTKIKSPKASRTVRCSDRSGRVLAKRFSSLRTGLQI
jgi:hypothetical protein